MKKAILINPFCLRPSMLGAVLEGEFVTETEVAEDDYKDIIRVLNSVTPDQFKVSTIAVTYICVKNLTYAVFIDDEGLLKGNYSAWININTSGSPIAGAGLVVCTNEEGDLMGVDELEGYEIRPEEVQATLMAICDGAFFPAWKSPFMGDGTYAS